MLHLLRMGPSKELTTFPIQIQSSRQLSLLELPPCHNTVTTSSGSFNTYTSTVQSGPPSANAALLPHPRLQTSYPPSALFITFSPAPSPPSLAPGCPSTPPTSSPAVTLQGFSNGMLEVFEPGAPNYFTFSCPILSILSVSMNPILTHLPLSGFLDSLLYVLIAPTPVLAFSLLMPRTLVAALSFLSGWAYPFLNFLSEHPLFLHSIPTLIMYGSTSLLTTSPHSLFLMCMPPLFAPPRRMAEPIPFLPPFFPPEISSFWGTSIAITLTATQKILSTPTGRKYSTGSSLLTSSPSMTLTHPPFYIAPLAVASLLISSLLPPLLPFLVPGRCFRTWVLTIYQFFCLSLSLRSITPTSVPLPSIFRKLAGMALPPTWTLTVLQQRNTHLFLFPLLLLSLPLWH